MKYYTKALRTSYRFIFLTLNKYHAQEIQSITTTLHHLPKRSKSIHNIQQSDFSAERNTIKVSGEIRHVDLSHTSPNEIFPHSLLSKWLKGGKKMRNWRRGDPPRPSFLYLDEWIVPLSLSFFSIKCLPFGMLPSFMIIKTFACQRRLRRRRKGGLGGTLNSISQPSALPALISRQWENAREGRLKEREINNDNKHTIHLRRAASMKNTYWWYKSVLFCLVVSLKILFLLRWVKRYQMLLIQSSKMFFLLLFFLKLWIQCECFQRNKKKRKTELHLQLNKWICIKEDTALRFCSALKEF